MASKLIQAKLKLSFRWSHQIQRSTVFDRSNREEQLKSERNLPFFEILKSAEVFQWGSAQQKAFEELKQYLIDLTTLTPPSSGAPLLLYVAASHAAVSEALVQEKQEGQVKMQAPVYFVSEVLSLSKKNYT
jgi:hypothetical protein